MAGGLSSRMKQDKSRLVMSRTGLEQREALYQLLQNLVEKVVFSINDDQQNDSYFLDKNTVVDHHLAIGPMGGIASVMEKYPQYSLLVLACDMPFLNQDVLMQLLETREVLFLSNDDSVTAKVDGFFFENENRLEPLVAIYENSLQMKIKQSIENKEFSLQKLLKRSNIKILPLVDAHSVHNINTMEEWTEAQALQSNEA